MVIKIKISYLIAAILLSHCFCGCRNPEPLPSKSTGYKFATVINTQYPIRKKCSSDAKIIEYPKMGKMYYLYKQEKKYFLVGDVSKKGEVIGWLKEGSLMIKRKCLDKDGSYLRTFPVCKASNIDVFEGPYYLKVNKQIRAGKQYYVYKKSNGKYLIGNFESIPNIPEGDSGIIGWVKMKDFNLWEFPYAAIFRDKKSKIPLFKNKTHLRNYYSNGKYFKYQIWGYIRNKIVEGPLMIIGAPIWVEKNNAFIYVSVSIKKGSLENSKNKTCLEGWVSLDDRGGQKILELAVMVNKTNLTLYRAFLRQIVSTEPTNNLNLSNDIEAAYLSIFGNKLKNEKIYEILKNDLKIKSWSPLLRYNLTDLKKECEHKPSRCVAFKNTLERAATYLDSVASEYAVCEKNGKIVPVYLNEKLNLKKTRNYWFNVDNGKEYAWVPWSYFP